MNIEEKAKAYDEVFERVKPLYEWAKKDDSPMWSTYEYLFPQLAESESEDERIRKNLVALVEAFGQGKYKNEMLAYLEKQKEQEPIKVEVYEVGKGTTICGQDYKCKKDYKEGNCWYIKDVIYHCGRNGYLTDQNGVSWSCTPEWFNEYIYSNAEWTDEEKNDFVSGQFLQCKLSFDEFKEGEHYWLEYVGDDIYVGRSDNILNQKFHITPRQLYTLFSQQLEEKQKEQNGEDEECTDFTIYHPLKNGKGKYECIPYSFYGSLTSFSEDKDLIDFLRTCFYTEEECNEWIDGQQEQKPAEWNKATINGKPIPTENHSVDIPLAEWSEEDRLHYTNVLGALEYVKGCKSDYDKIEAVKSDIAWLRELPERFNLPPKQEWSEEDERMLVGIIERGSAQIPPHEPALRGEQMEWLMNWLKSLRNRPKPSDNWKPSEEQMKALSNNVDKARALYFTSMSGYGEYIALRSLYEELNRLRG